MLNILTEVSVSWFSLYVVHGGGCSSRHCCTNRIAFVIRTYIQRERLNWATVFDKSQLQPGNMYLLLKLFDLNDFQPRGFGGIRAIRVRCWEFIGKWMFIGCEMYRVSRMVKPLRLMIFVHIDGNVRTLFLTQFRFV